jgi:hypothetical protein
VTDLEVLRAFVAPDAALDGPRSEMPLTLPVEAWAGERVADIVLLLALIAAFWGLGVLLRRAGASSLRPIVLAAGLTGLLLLFGTNTSFYEVAAVELSEDMLVIKRHVGADDAVSLDEIKSFSLESGRIYPWFSDDRMLIITTSEGSTVALPRFVPHIEEAARHLADRLSPPPALHEEGRP